MLLYTASGTKILFTDTQMQPQGHWGWDKLYNIVSSTSPIAPGKYYQQNRTKTNAVPAYCWQIQDGGCLLLVAVRFNWSFPFLAPLYSLARTEIFTTHIDKLSLHYFSLSSNHELYCRCLHVINSLCDFQLANDCRYGALNITIVCKREWSVYYNICGLTF